MNTTLKQIGAAAGLMFAMACTQSKDYKTVREEVMKFHDVVMGDQGQIIHNQMKLDSMLKDLSGLKIKFPQLDTLKEMDTMKIVSARLVKADDSMNTWMHQFEPDVTGKSNEAAVAYFEGEKAKIQKVDSLFKQEIKYSDAYLNKFKK